MLSNRALLPNMLNIWMPNPNNRPNPRDLSNPVPNKSNSKTKPNLSPEWPVCLNALVPDKDVPEDALTDPTSCNVLALQKLPVPLVSSLKP